MFDVLFKGICKAKATHMGWQIISAEHPIKMSGLAQMGNTHTHTPFIIDTLDQPFLMLAFEEFVVLHFGAS